MAADKWDDRFYVKAYLCARQGAADKTIAKTIGVTQPTFDKWKRTKPALADAINSARTEIEQGHSTEEFVEYVYNRLPPELQEYFNQIKGWEDEPNSIRRVEKLLRKQGRRARQYLFLHRLVNNGFVVADACRFVNIRRSTFEMWVTTEPEFGELLQEMIEAKKDLCEGALHKLVRKGDTAAVIFANKTLNRDRGYGDKVSVEVSGQINHLHAVVKISELDLDLETRRNLLDALRKKKKVLETSATHSNLIEA
jgi:hypothetical protein